MKKLTALIAIGGISFSFLTTPQAETIKMKECTYTEEYKRYISLEENERQKAIVPVMCKEEFLYNGFRANQQVTSSISDSKFDLRDSSQINPTILDQGEAGICWGIATMESIQSSALKEQNKSYDLSEGHLELSTQKTYPFNRLTYNRSINIGGNYYLSAAYLLNHWGPVNEPVYSLDKLKQTLTNTYTPTENEILNTKNALDVNQIMITHAAQGACTNDSKMAIKQYLITNGALAAMGYFDIYGEGASVVDGTITSTFTNGPYYYYDGSAYTDLDGTTIEANQEVNHGITIIGWDDTISKTQFASGHQPQNDGAWIIKNSWGTKLLDSINIGDEGYYYVSYEDINICSTLSGFYDIDTTPTDHAYYHDDLGYNTSFTVNEAIKNMYLGSIYTKESSEEQLEKVTFASLKENQQYKVYFANNGTFKDLELVGTGTTNHSGYTTVKLDTPKKITNSKFSVAVEYIDTEQLQLPALVSFSDSLFSTATIKAASTYLSADKINWSDTKESSTPFQLSIRAYTNTVETPTPCTTNNGKYYNTDGNEVPLEDYEKSCNPKCQEKDNKYYDNNGHEVDQTTYESTCNPKCSIKDNKYYDNNGHEVDKETYETECLAKCEKKNGKYYDKDGNEASLEDYEKSCNPKCSTLNDKYYNANGHEVDKPTYEQECLPKCATLNGKYYNNKGEEVNQTTFEQLCNPKCEKKNEKYYNQKGQEVSKSEFEQDCREEEIPQNNGTSIDIQENDANADVKQNTIENPSTGNFLPIILFLPLTIISIYFLLKTKKAKIYKL